MLVLRQSLLRLLIARAALVGYSAPALAQEAPRLQGSDKGNAPKYILILLILLILILFAILIFILLFFSCASRSPASMASTTSCPAECRRPAKRLLLIFSSSRCW